MYAAKPAAPRRLGHHSHPSGTPRTVQIYAYLAPEEVQLLDRLTTQVAHLPVSRSLLVRLSLDVLSGLLAAGVRPDLSRYEVVKRQPKKDRRGPGGLVVNLASIRGRTTDAAQAA